MLNDDAAALAYACQLAQELVQSGARPDPSMLVKVRDDTRPMVLSIPLLAACASSWHRSAEAAAIVQLVLVALDEIAHDDCSAF